MNGLTQSITMDRRVRLLRLGALRLSYCGRLGW